MARTRSLLRERYHEAHDLVMRAWTEPDTFAFNGRFNQQRYVNIWPRPVQKPHPPIWIPGGGSVETWQWCAQMDYVYCYLSYYGYKVGQATMDGFWAEMARLGKDRNPYRAGFLQFVGVAESREQAMGLYREPAEYFYGRCLHIDPRFAAPPGYATEATQRRGMAEPGRRWPRRPRATNRSSRCWRARWMRSSTTAMSSSARPTRSRTSCVEVATDLNVGNLMLLLQFGNMDKGLTRYNTKLFAEKVMPQLATCSPNGSTAGGRSRWPTRRALRCPGSSRRWSRPNNRGPILGRRGRRPRNVAERRGSRPRRSDAVRPGSRRLRR